MIQRLTFRIGTLTLVGLCAASCGDDDNGGPTPYDTVADRYGVGAPCSADSDCLQPEDGSFTQECLTEFNGGYCGLTGCASNADCPPGSACATENGNTYCFRQCTDKPQCNCADAGCSQIKRPTEIESNCSSSVDLVDEGTPTKLCVPSSSGTG